MIRKTLLGGGVLVAFLVLVGALFAIPAWADLVSISHTTLEDFNAGTLYHTGLTRYDDGEVQLIVVGLSGDWITDTNTTGLPALARHTAVYTNNHIIVLGGRKSNSVPSADVYYTTIQTETHDLENWQATTPLTSTAYPNGGLFWHTSAIVHDRVYVLGGRDNKLVEYATVTFAPIQDDGSLGDWQITTPLTTPFHLGQAVALHGRIYVMGGQPGSSGALDTVYIGEPDPATGMIDKWIPTRSLPYPTFAHMAVVDGDRIYIMGGYHPTLGGIWNFVSPYVYYASADPATGQLSAWIQLTNMEHNLFGGAGLSNRGVLFTTGGAINNMTEPSDYVGATLIGDDGRIGSWTNTSLVSPVRFYHAAVRSDDGWLYVINGTNGGGPIRSINRGATSGVGAKYADSGVYTSSTMSLGKRYRLKQLQWNCTISDTAVMSITMEYRVKDNVGDDWSAWFGPYTSSMTPGTVTTTHAVTGMARYVQYRAALHTSDNTMTPSLNAVRLVYETPSYSLRVFKGASPPAGSTLIPGDEITYTLSYSNGLDGITTTNTIIADNVPEYTSYVPNSIFGIGADDSNPKQLHWDIGEVPPGGKGQVGFRVVVSPTLMQNVTIQNVASIDSDEGTIRYSEEILHSVQAMFGLDLAQGAKPSSGTSVLPGDLITYTLTCINSGARDIVGLVLTDALPAEVTYDPGTIWPAPQGDDGNPRKLVWDFGNLAPGQQVSARFRAVVNGGVPSGITVTNQFTAASDYTWPQTSAVVTHVVGAYVASVSLTKSANPPTGSAVQPGQTIVYTLHYLNDGETTISDLVLTDVLPHYVTYVEDSISPPAQGKDDDPERLRWNVPALAPGASGTASFEVTVDDVPGGLMIENQFEATSAQIELQESNMTTHVTDRQAPDFTITQIRTDPADPSPGVPFSVFVTVKNIGTQDADDHFWVEVYIRPRPSTEPDGPADHTLGYCATSSCTPPLRDQYVEAPTSLDAQASFTLEFAGITLPVPGNYDIYAQADVAFLGDDPDWGRYKEENENNNIKGIFLDGGLIYLPQVTRNH